MGTKKPTKKPEGLRTHEGGTRKEYPQASKERVVREVLSETYTVLEASRRYGLTSAQVNAWIGQAITENWGGIRDAFITKASPRDGKDGKDGDGRMENMLQRFLGPGASAPPSTGDTSISRQLSPDQVALLARLADALKWHQVHALRSIRI
jgi:hypothetical protein